VITLTENDTHTHSHSDSDTDNYPHTDSISIITTCSVEFTQWPPCGFDSQWGQFYTTISITITISFTFSFTV